MKIEIKLPQNCSPMLLDIRRDKGDSVRIGDILFSYEADGALFFEYSACNGKVTGVSDLRGQRLLGGETVLTVDSLPLPPNTEMFPSDDPR